MTRIFAALCGLALTSGLSVAMADGPCGCGALAPACGCNHGGCNNCGCQPCEKVCVTVPTTKKIPHTIYGCRCIDFCIAHNKEFHCCDSCGHREGCGCGCECCPGVCAGCEHPRVRKALIKWVHIQECPTFKCEVRCTCCPGQCGCQGQCGGQGGYDEAGPGMMEGAAPIPSGPAPVPPSARRDNGGPMNE